MHIIMYCTDIAISTLESRFTVAQTRRYSTFNDSDSDSDSSTPFRFRFRLRFQSSWLRFRLRLQHYVYERFRFRLRFQLRFRFNSDSSTPYILIVTPELYISSDLNTSPGVYKMCKLFEHYKPYPKQEFKKKFCFVIAIL